MLAPSNSKTRTILIGLLGQSLPDMTEDEMEYWVQHPEGLPAVLAGLKPKLAPAGDKAPLHVGTPPRTIDFHRPDGGVTRAVSLASDQPVEMPLSVSKLPIRLDGLEDWQRADRVRNGTEKSSDVYQLDDFDVNPMDQ